MQYKNGLLIFYIYNIKLTIIKKNNGYLLRES